MKRSFIALFFFVLALSSEAQNLADISFGEDPSLEVITWNVREFPINESATADSLKTALMALHADVFALQEMYDTLAIHNMVDEMDGYETYYQDPDFGGLAVIYNTQAIEFVDVFEIFYTPAYWNYFTRAPVVLEFYFQGDFYALIDNHFKCCGDGFLDQGNEEDEEFRREQASILLDSYIASQYPDDNVIVVGDFNDILTDSPANNVFQAFLDDPDVKFADMEIAQGSQANWSFPGWPSHLDHILVSNELFEALNDNNAVVQTIHVEDYLAGGWNAYYDLLSDHRPVGMKIWPGTLGTTTLASARTAFRLYPNPVLNGRLNVDRTEIGNTEKMEIFNGTGQLIETFNIEKGDGKQVVDVSLLSPGYYYLKLGREIRKFIVSGTN